MRCHLECNSLVFLKMRCEALLKCINALNLVVPEYAWIAKPSIFKESKSQEESVSRSNLELNHFTRILCATWFQTPQIEVISLQDVRKELMVTEAVLEISKHLDDYRAVLDVDTNELIIILANSKLYSTAFKLAHALDKSVLPVYESLATSCVMCSLQESADNWDWLHKNNLAGDYNVVFLMHVLLLIFLLTFSRFSYQPRQHGYRMEIFAALLIEWN